MRSPFNAPALPRAVRKRGPLPSSRIPSTGGIWTKIFKLARLDLAVRSGAWGHRIHPKVASQTGNSYSRAVSEVSADRRDNPLSVPMQAAYPTLSLGPLFSLQQRFHPPCHLLRSKLTRNKMLGKRLTIRLTRRIHALKNTLIYKHKSVRWFRCRALHPRHMTYPATAYAFSQRIMDPKQGELSLRFAACPVVRVVAHMPLNGVGVPIRDRGPTV